MNPNTILNGDCIEELKKLPNGSINMCMTSPPYWALRDYGVEGQLGLEPTFDEYINKLCNIFDEVKRILRDEGTCWVNIGDTYNAGGNYRGKELGDGSKEVYRRKDFEGCKNNPKEQGISAKSLCMVPFRFAIEMVNRGWILRNTIIWHKSNCMPSSIKDRFTVDFEYLFFFSKKKNYYFEQQLEPTITKDNIIRDRDTTKLNNTPGRTKMGGLKTNDYDEKNKRTVWNINPKPFKEAHFAVYPEELCETPIKAGCPKYVCVKCGNPKSKQFEYNNREKQKSIFLRTKYDSLEDERKVRQGFDSSRDYIQPIIKNLGYKPTCNCNESFISGIVLDPFFGAGTTGVVALKQGKKFLGIELNKEYIKIANARLKPYLEQRKLL